MKYSKQLGRLLGANVADDKEGMHPKSFCNTCWAKLRKLEKASCSDPHHSVAIPIFLD